VTRFGASNREVSRTWFGRDDALDIGAPAPHNARAPSAKELHDTLQAMFKLNWRAGAVSAYVLSKIMDHLEKGQPPAEFAQVQISDSLELPRKIGHVTVSRIEAVLASGFLPDLNLYAFPEPEAAGSP
jgi:hypothetical protein